MIDPEKLLQKPLVDMSPEEKLLILNEAIAMAAVLEDADKHVPADQREALVALYRELYPDEKLPENANDAYVDIIS